MGEIAERIAREVGACRGVETAPHLVAGVEPRNDGYGIACSSGEWLAGVPFPRITGVDVGAHHILRNAGWITFPIRSPADPPSVIDPSVVDPSGLGYPRIRAGSSPAESADSAATERA